MQLLRPDKTDVRPAGFRRCGQHRVFAGVAHTALQGRHTLLSHPARGSAHAGGAVQRLESAGPALGQCARCGAVGIGLDDAETGRSELEYGHVRHDHGALLQRRRIHAEDAGKLPGTGRRVFGHDVGAFQREYRVGMRCCSRTADGERATVLDERQWQAVLSPQRGEAPAQCFAPGRGARAIDGIADHGAARAWPQHPRQGHRSPERWCKCRRRLR